MLYPRPQLTLLLALAATLLVGLGVREWRAGFPDAAERLERFDREDDAALLPEPVPARLAPATSAAPRAPGATTSPAPGSARPGVGALAPPRATTPGTPAPGPPPPAEPLDVNLADAAALARLPGVSATLAQRIVEERERRGRFDSPDALRYVLGMGPKKLAAIRPFIAVRD
jgi:DNA uptake protein ComE-like DNA-binding protein